eukprot:246215-Hanusia_phi.AAC.1
MRRSRQQRDGRHLVTLSRYKLRTDRYGDERYLRKTGVAPTEVEQQPAQAMPTEEQGAYVVFPRRLRTAPDEERPPALSITRASLQRLFSMRQ